MIYVPSAHSWNVSDGEEKRVSQLTIPSLLRMVGDNEARTCIADTGTAQQPGGSRVFPRITAAWNGFLSEYICVRQLVDYGRQYRCTYIQPQISLCSIEAIRSSVIRLRHAPWASGSRASTKEESTIRRVSTVLERLARSKSGESAGVRQ